MFHIHSWDYDNADIVPWVHIKLRCLRCGRVKDFAHTARDEFLMMVVPVLLLLMFFLVFWLVH